MPSWSWLVANLKSVWRLFVQTLWGWMGDRAARKGAALSFYMVFSLAPILIISIAVAGFFFGEEAARTELVGQIRELIGPEGAAAIELMIRNAARPGSGFLPTVIGIGTLLIGATTALAELKDGLDQIWRAPPERTQGWMYTVRKRLLSLGLVLALGLLLVVSLAASAVLAALTRHWGGSMWTIELLRIVNFLLTFAVISVIFAGIYKVLPACHVAWSDVWVGAIVTALLFNIGKYLIGIYLGNSAVTSTYGAAGSVILVLLWVYYSSQILLFGAEFTRFYAYRYGSRRHSPDAPSVLQSAAAS